MHRPYNIQIYESIVRLGKHRHTGNRGFMSYSEDQTSPAAPFSGDSSGHIFDMPDMVATSPTTTERVVDTQSGFLVVIKKIGDRLALSIKRNIGTPPSSSVSLTPDESLKLSRILSTSLSSEETESDSLIEEFRSRSSRRRRGASKLFESDESKKASTEEDLAESPASGKTKMPMKLMLASVLRTFMVPIVGVALSVFVLGIGAGIGAMKLVEKPQVVAPVVDPFERVKVDGFVRDFVAKMLDFTSKTYRISQVQAMAAMSPDLMERYWTQTNFPLSRRQLAKAPQGANILITEMKQERLDESNVQVDVHAQMTNANDPKLATPVNIRLKLSLDANGQIFVSDQQDLTSETK